jgi:hypothetical protein
MRLVRPHPQGDLRAPRRSQPRLDGELHRGRHGAAGEIDFALAGLGVTVDPSAPQIEALAEGRADARAVLRDNVFTRRRIRQAEIPASAE